ncbi:MAG: FAD-dependent oxidoreductase [Acidobacteria bacterium]|nr:FAD-dependent oxidoreductase [Acidobacteriota bacterium]
MKIAIVGSGVSGLTAAYRLHRRHEVTVFEAGDRVGGHTNTMRFELDGEEWAVDTGFIVYNERNYPLFTALLAELGVESQPTSMSFSVRSDPANLEYNGTSLDQLFAQRRNLLRPSFYRMLRDILRFHREAPALQAASGDDVSVADFLTREGYSREFAEHYLTPLGSALWSSPPGTFRSFPIRFVVEFLANHSMLQVEGRPTWRVIRGGSCRYVEKLTASFRDRILLNTPVRAVERRPGHVRLVDAQGAEGRFDHVIFACHSDQALRIVQDPTTTEAELLGEFPYQANEAVLHTDPSVLPRRRKAWASWNYHVRPDAADRATVTYNMNLLQGLPWRRVFNVTLNDSEAIRPESVIHKIVYHHPLFTARRGEAQRRHPELIDANGTSYCGAYWGYGFHEDGVRSAAAVCEALAQRREAAA